MSNTKARCWQISWPTVWLIYRCEPSKEPSHVNNPSSVRNTDALPRSVRTSSAAYDAQSGTQ